MNCPACGSSNLSGYLQNTTESSIQFMGIQPTRKRDDFKLGSAAAFRMDYKLARICLDCGHVLFFVTPEDRDLVTRMPAQHQGSPTPER